MIGLNSPHLSIGGMAKSFHAWEIRSQAKAGTDEWIECYNRKRPDSAFAGNPPAVV